MTKKKNEKIKNEINKEGFMYKYKNDDKYKAKVELTGYVIFILLVILFINVASLGNSYSSNNLSNPVIPTNKNNEEDNTEDKLLEKIDDNYQYDININLVKTTEEIINYRYHGKSYDNTIEINKDINNTTTTYYKVDDNYYKKNEQEYITANTSEIYDLINSNYIELDSLLDYINEASLDHVTNYSNGKKEYVYNLYIRDIIINNKTEDLITINAEEVDEVLTVDVDYTNLTKEMDNTIKECKISYIFSNIDKVEVFSIYETSKENLGEVNE